MSLRLRSSGIFVFLCILLVSAAEISNRVTAKDANNKCGKAGMDPFVLINMTTVYSQELRTGLGIFIQFSPWIEIIGCFQPEFYQYSYYRQSAGLCAQACSTEYFGYSVNITFRHVWYIYFIMYSNRALIGGVLGAVSLIILTAVLIVCKVRSKGILTKSNTRDYEDTSHVNCSATTYKEIDNIKHKSETAITNQACDIDESVVPVYEEVNEIEIQGNIISK